MFTKCDLKPLELNDNNIFLGIVRYNENKIKNNLERLIEQERKNLQVIKIGKIDFEKSDQFIISALNDYYKRITEATEEEKNTMLSNYNRLYESWTLLNQAKAINNFHAMEEYYESLSYQLYLLGYKMTKN